MGLLINAATQTLVELRMNTEGYKYKSETLRQAYAEGLAAGRAVGEARGMARAVLLVLDERRIVVTEEVAGRIRAETDLQRLDEWVRAAVHCADARELFERVS